MAGAAFEEVGMRSTRSARGAKDKGACKTMREGRDLVY